MVRPGASKADVSALRDSEQGMAAGPRVGRVLFPGARGPGALAGRKPRCLGVCAGFAAEALRIGDEVPWRGHGGRWRLWALPTYEEDAVVIPSADDSLPSQGTRAGRWSPRPGR